MARLLAVAIVLAGCTQPQFEPCSITCTVACPFGLTCADDGFCHGSDDRPCAVPDDAAGDDATADAPPADSSGDCLGTPLPLGCGNADLIECGGTCLAHCKNSQDWANARTTCESWGSSAHLVEVGSSQENACLFGLINDREAWIGLFQPFGSSEPDGGWIWASGEPVAYLNWGPGEPNDASGNEDCALLHPADNAWNDDDCGAFQEFVCELP